MELEQPPLNDVQQEEQGHCGDDSSPLLQAFRRRQQNGDDGSWRTLLKSSSRDHLNEVLEMACDEQDVTAVRTLLQAGADANAPEIFWYGRWDRPPDPDDNEADGIAVASLLLAHGASANQQDRGIPLMLHATETRSEATADSLCRLLLRHGADVNARTRTGRTVLRAAAVRGFPNVISVLLQAGATIDAQHPEVRLPLRTLLQRPDPASRCWECLEAFFTHRDVHPDQRATDGWAALHYAIREKGQPTDPTVIIPRLVRLLQRHGADVNLPERHDPHETPLTMACRDYGVVGGGGGRVTWVRTLLDAGAIVVDASFTALFGSHPATDTGAVHVYKALLGAVANDPRRATLAHLASSSWPHGATWLPLLVRYAHDDDDDDDDAPLRDARGGQTPLHVAAAHCHVPAVRFWLTHRPAWINMRDERGRLPLHHACRPCRRHPPHPVTGLRFRTGWNNDHDKCFQYQTVELLLQAGSDPLFRDTQGNLTWFELSSSSSSPLDSTFTLIKASAQAGLFCQLT